MASFSPPTHFSTASSSSYSKPHLIYKPFTYLKSKNPFFLLSTNLKASADNGVGTSAVTQVEPPLQAVSEPTSPPPASENVEGSVGTNGSVAGVAEEAKAVATFNFKDARWVNGTWDLKQFQKNGTTDWDAVIDAGEVYV